MIVRCIDNTLQRDVLAIGREYQVYATTANSFRLGQTIQQAAV